MWWYRQWNFGRVVPQKLAMLATNTWSCRAFWVVVLCACGFRGEGPRLTAACTTIIVGKSASADGSTMCTHNADCNNCDFRLGRVPARDWPPGSERPVIKFRSGFPRTVTEGRGVTWTPENLDPGLPQRNVWTSDEWRNAMVIGHIPQVDHTFAYLEGLYAILNEKQVGIGESTCGAKWFAGPVDEDCKECNALFDISELSRIALERASTAREAIQIMGDLAVEYGFYGSVWDSTNRWVYREAGEGLTVTDPNETWVFHIMPDDTTTSAIWAAQRVPDDHISVVANQFIIKEVHPDADPDYFMFSSNLFEVAERGNCYKSGSGYPLNFTKAFSKRLNDVPHYPYSTRRMCVKDSHWSFYWSPSISRDGSCQIINVMRVLDVFAPSLGLSPYTTSLAENYPFSVKPDNLVSTQDVIKMVRDHYEGTQFDLSTELAGGPYGSVDRFDPQPSLDGSTTKEDVDAGFFERSISHFRTSYSSVTQSRANLPNEVGALLWVAQYKPSMSTFVPFYVAIEEVPRPYTIGSLFRFDKETPFWSFSVVGNWAERFRRFAYADVMETQKALETPLFKAQEDIESKATALVEGGDIDGAVALFTKHANSSATAAVSTYHEFFDTLVAKYHDGYQLQSPLAGEVKYDFIFYPKFWLEAIGYFHSLQDDADATQAAQAGYGEEHGSKQPSRDVMNTYHHGTPATGASPTSSKPDAEATPRTMWQAIVCFLVGATSTLVVGILLGKWSPIPPGYTNIPGRV